MSIRFIVSAGIGVAVGVASGFVWNVGIWILLPIACLVIIRFPYVGIGLLCGMLVGWGRVFGFLAPSPLEFTGSEESIAGIVAKNPDVRVDHTRLVLADVERLERSYEDRLLVYAPLYPSARVGDRVSMMCILREPEPLEDFRWDRWLARHHIRATCSYPRNMVVLDLPLSAMHRLLRFGDWIGGRINRSLPEPEAGLLRGLLLGEQHAMSDETLEQFHLTGTTHIVALSGFNVTIILGLIARAGVAFRLRPLARGASAAILVIVFLVLTGMDSSLVRASLMGLTLIAASLAGRRSVFPIVVSIVGAGMVLINPYVLLYDAGFQLSFLATIGLYTLSTRIERFVRWVPTSYMMRDSFVATLSAIIPTLPLFVFTFHRVSVVAPLANVLILPLVPLSMALGLLPVVLPHWLAATPVYATLHVMLAIVGVLSRLPYSSFTT